MTPDKNDKNDGDRVDGQTSYGRAKELFLRLVDLPPDQREPHLAEIFDENPDVEGQVRLLLAHHDRENGTDPAGREPGPVLPPTLGPFVPARLLGEGGTGAVYLAYHQEDQSPAALKVLHPGILARESRLRFSRESEVLDRLDHPGIARLLTTGEEATPHGPVYYIATVFIDGPRLDHHLQATEPDLEEKLGLALGICEAVAHAHEAGVVHRDLKPPNILVTSDGKPHILDFGVSRILGTTSIEMTAVTETGQLIGTLKYMSPEQVKGERIGPQTDVYALGLIIQEILTGKLPYDVPASPIHQSMAAVLTAQPAWPSDQVPGLDPALDAIVARCLDKDPGGRYHHATELAGDLRSHLAGKPVSAPDPERTASPGSFRWTRWLAAALLLVAIVLFIWQPWRKEAEPVEQDPSVVLGMLDLADQELHFKQHTLPGLSRAVALLDSARIHVHQLAEIPTKTALQRYVSWRLGEAFYFLGAKKYDPREYRLALRSFEEANHPLFDPVELAALPADAPITSRARRRGRHHPSLGQALAYAALAEHQRPRYNLEQAIIFCEEARRIQSEMRGPNYWPALTEMQRQEDRAIVLNDYARNLTRQALVCDSIPLVEQALPMYAQADTFSALRTNNSAYGSLLLGRARAFLTRAELASSSADLDSTRFFLDRCLGLGETGYATRFRIHLMMTEATFLEAEWGKGHASALEAFIEAGNWAIKSRKILGDQESGQAPDLKTRLLQMEARIVRSQAQVLSDTTLLGHADRLLTQALSSLPPERFTPLRASLYLEKCEVALVGFSLSGDPVALRTAEDHLRQGLPFASPAIHPRLARLYTQAQHKVASATAKKASEN